LATGWGDKPHLCPIKKGDFKMVTLKRQPAMRLRNVQTNNIFSLTNREQIGECLKRTFNSQVACQRWVDGQRKEEFIIRSIPRFEILECDDELKDLVPVEEATRSIREQLIGKDKIDKLETIDDLKKFAYEKGIHHHPSIGYEKLQEKIETWKTLNASYK
jgi:hypothetical protein